MKTTCSLISETWIPLRSGNGKKNCLGLIETLTTAHEWKEIETGSPLEDAALLRLLMAIILRVLHPEDHEELAEIIEKGSFPSVPFQKYFSQWADRFDLFDEKHPFYQCLDRETCESKPTTPAKLSHSLASGNNATLFNHTLDNIPDPLNPMGAARLLVTTQSFALGGGVSKPFNFSHAPLADGFLVVLQGKNLFQTICLNLAGFVEPPDAHDADRDIPCWERDAPVNPQRRYPWGWLDHLTWQSRRIILEKTDGKITAIRMLQGDAPLKDPVPFEPAFAHQCRDEKIGFLPLKLRQDRVLWRDLDSLATSYPLAPTTGKTGPIQTNPPSVVRNLYKLSKYFPELGDHRIAVDIYGMCSDQAKIFFWQHQRFPLPMAYLENKALSNILHRSLNLAENTAQALSTAIWFLAQFLLESDTSEKEPEKKAISARANSLSTIGSFWNSLEEPFLLHYENIPTEGETTLEEWQKTLRVKARNAFAEAGKNLSGKARELKAFAKAETILLGRLKKTLNS